MTQENLQSHHIDFSPGDMDNLTLYGITNTQDQKGKLWTVQAPPGYDYEPGGPKPEAFVIKIPQDKWNELMSKFNCIVYATIPPDPDYVLIYFTKDSDVEKKE